MVALTSRSCLDTVTPTSWSRISLQTLTSRSRHHTSHLQPWYTMVLYDCYLLRYGRTMVYHGITWFISECFDLPQQPEKLAAAFHSEEFIQCIRLR